MTTQTSQVLDFVRQQGIVSRGDLREAGLPEEYLAKLATTGRLSALAPGVYMDIEGDPGEHLELAVVAKRVPRAIFFGITALEFHGLTTQVAHAIEFAIERGTRPPKLEWPTLDVFNLSGASFSAGIEEHTIEGNVTIRVYSVAKTVADLFKFRSRFGLDVAIEALKEGWEEKRFEIGELETCAKACRVQNVMQPYMEMLP